MVSKVRDVRDPFANAGAHLITELLALPETRLSNKFRVKTVRLGGSFSVKYAGVLWDNSFITWRMFILEEE